MMEGGTIRVKGADWAHLTKLAIAVTLKLQRPVNQATVLHAIMQEKMEDVTQAEAVEMVKGYLGLK